MEPLPSNDDRTYTQKPICTVPLIIFLFSSSTVHVAAEVRNSLERVEDLCLLNIQVELLAKQRRFNPIIIQEDQQKGVPKPE